MEHSRNTAPVERAAGVFSKPVRLLLALLAFTVSFTIESQAQEKTPPEAEQPLLESDEHGPVPTTLRGAEGEAQNDLAGTNHKLVLHPYAGMPSFLLFTSGDTSIAEVRALLNLDGRLLAVPLRFRSDTKSFVGIFPTPAEQLSYQFQVVLADGRSVLSDRYASSVRCEQDALAEVGKIREAFPQQQALLEEAVQLDKEGEVLQYVINSIEAVLKNKEEK